MDHQCLRALVVEDQELFRKAVEDELAFFGFKVFAAKDGKEGLKIAQSTKFDLILSDIRMPNGDGKWLLGELRKTMKVAPPFLFMTGFADLPLQDAYEMGADGFLGKPLNHDKLTAMLAKVCRPIQSRWTERPTTAADKSISLNFSNLDIETMRRQLALGRGGMFLANNQVNAKLGSTIAFDIKFDNGPLKRLEGIGTVVWKRDQSEEDGLTAYGIDFTYISHGSLPNWLAFLAANEIVAVIPKGKITKVGDQNSNIDIK
jgi:DNA-binding response OmpR family regulator